jgi:mRNA interferase RelE/StbE
MVSYKIEILKSADKDIRKIDKRYILPIFQAIKTLSKDPLPTECKKLKGSESSYRIRVGNYRII